MSADRRKVYRYRTPEDKKFTGLALGCQMHQRDGEDWKELWYHDTTRPHMIQGEIAKETDDGFIFRSDGYDPGEWVFQELTIEDFRRWVYKHVGGGEIIVAKIHTTADLHEWFRRKFDIE